MVESDPDALAWTTYQNARFGTVVEYPATLLRMLPPPENDDGRSFEGIGQDVHMLVFAFHDVFDSDVRARLTELTGSGGFDSILQIEASEMRLFLRGMRDGRMVRLTEIHAPDDIVHTLDISHDPEIGDGLDAQLARIEQSFTVSRGGTRIDRDRYTGDRAGLLAVNIRFDRSGGFPRLSGAMAGGRLRHACPQTGWIVSNPGAGRAPRDGHCAVARSRRLSGAAPWQSGTRRDHGRGPGPRLRPISGSR